MELEEHWHKKALKKNTPMPRRSYKKLPVKKDILYNSLEVNKLINYLMKDGKKDVASSIVYDTFDRLKKESKNPLEVFKKAIDNVAPNVEVRPRRVGGASYLVPVETRPERRLYLALNWIIETATARSNKEYKTFSAKLYNELIDAANNVGGAIEKRKQIEKVAEANRAFAHFKW
jgi:small subunit ribosomal protein S7